MRSLNFVLRRRGTHSATRHNAWSLSYKKRRPVASSARCAPSLLERQEQEQQEEKETVAPLASSLRSWLPFLSRWPLVFLTPRFLAETWKTTKPMKPISSEAVRAPRRYIPELLERHGGTGNPEFTGRVVKRFPELCLRPEVTACTEYLQLRKRHSHALLYVSWVVVHRVSETST